MTSLPRVSSVQVRLKVLARHLRTMIGRGFGRPGSTELSDFEPVGAAELLPCPPACYEADQLDRILACGFGQDAKTEIAKLDSTSFEGSPAKRYSLGESILVGGTIITKDRRHVLRWLPEWRSLRTEMVSHDRATLLNSMQGLRYFGHWLQDDCSFYEMVRDEPILLSMPRPDWPDSHVYEQAFDQNWRQTDFAHIGDLTVWREIGYSRDKARRIGTLRERLRQMHPERGDGKPVYIRRGKLGEPRDMSNAVMFEEAMRNAGVIVLEPERGREAMVRAMLDAPLVIAIEGSHACHGIYTLANGGSFLILQPPERFYNPLRGWAALLGMRYGFVVGRKDETSFYIDPDEVLRMVDRLLAG